MIKPLILLTNDDGIKSPGLAAAASALDPLGELLIIAPLDQQTSMGRSRVSYGSGECIFKEIQVNYQDQNWLGYGVETSPAQVVEHAVIEIASRPISLVVSGINYGANISTNVTASGTVGAAIEGADWGIPALAVAQEIAGTDYHSYSTSVDFSSAVHFTRIIAQDIINKKLPFDADVIKLEVPLSATPETKCVLTRLDRKQYYGTKIEERESFLTTPTKVKRVAQKGIYSGTDTDAYALAQGWVSITPLSIDLTAHAAMEEIADLFKVEKLQDEKSD